MASHSATLFDLPTLPFNTVCEFQRDLVHQAQGDPHAKTLLLVEHHPVFTLGRTAKAEHYGHQLELLRGRGASVHFVERGGSITYHGPGQIVGYPILPIRQFCSGPKRYMRMLEDVIIRVIGEWGISGKRIEKFTGVWVPFPKTSPGGFAKIAAMGVRIDRGVTMHGFALNVTVDLTPFDLIVPCGIKECRVTSMARLMGESLDLQAVRARLAYHFSEVFDLEWQAVFRELPEGETCPCLSG